MNRSVNHFFSGGFVRLHAHDPTQDDVVAGGRGHVRSSRKKEGHPKERNADVFGLAFRDTPPSAQNDTFFLTCQEKSFFLIAAIIHLPQKDRHAANLQSSPFTAYLFCHQTACTACQKGFDKQAKSSSGGAAFIDRNHCITARKAISLPSPAARHRRPSARECR